MKQSPAPDAHLVKWRGDTLEVTLELDSAYRSEAAQQKIVDDFTEKYQTDSF